MPSLEQIQQQVASLNLKPEVAQHLAALLSTYVELKFDCDALTHQMDIERMAIGHILDEHGVDKAKIEGFGLEWHRGETTKKLDAMKLIAQGVTMAQIEAATTEKPKKDYFKINPPRSAKAESDED